METVRFFIRSHPLLGYFSLTFAISWGAILIVAALSPGGILPTKEHYEPMVPFLYVAMLAGPSVAGLVLRGLLYGRTGLRELLTGMTRWRVGARWYAAALLTAPLAFAVVLLALSLTSSAFVPGIFTSEEKVTLALMGIVAGIIVGFFEELGWTGFAVPTLLRQGYGVLGTGLIVGSLWGVWHFLVNVLAGDASSGALPVAVYVPAILFASLAWLTAFRVLMVWVYERTDGSLLLAMLMHLSLVASTVVILNPMATGLALAVYNLVWAAALWGAVGVVAMANGWHITRRPPLRRRVV
jgi:membrane protease YdiL (CAAX protease family)